MVATTSMTSQVIVQLDNVSGAPLRVMNCLKKLGLRTVKHVLKDTPTGQKLLALEVEGSAKSEDEIRRQLSTVDSVRQILKVSGATASARAEPEVETRYKNQDSEAGDAEIRDRMLIFSLLNRYPKIANRLVEITGEIPKEEQAARMQEIGRGFGRFLFGNLKIKGDVDSLAAAFELAIVPALAPFGQLSQNGNTVAFSSFTKAFDGGVARPQNCQFILGTLEGLLTGAESLPPYRVSKTRCLHEGASGCEYQIDPA